MELNNKEIKEKKIMIINSAIAKAKDGGKKNKKNYVIRETKKRIN